MMCVRVYLTSVHHDIHLQFSYRLRLRTFACSQTHGWLASLVPSLDSSSAVCTAVHGVLTDEQMSRRELWPNFLGKCAKEHNFVTVPSSATLSSWQAAVAVSIASCSRCSFWRSWHRSCSSSYCLWLLTVVTSGRIRAVMLQGYIRVLSSGELAFMISIILAILGNTAVQQFR